MNESGQPLRAPSHTVDNLESSSSEPGPNSSGCVDQVRDLSIQPNAFKDDTANENADFSSNKLVRRYGVEDNAPKTNLIPSPESTPPSRLEVSPRSPRPLRERSPLNVDRKVHSPTRLSLGGRNSARRTRASITIPPGSYGQASREVTPPRRLRSTRARLEAYRMPETPVCRSDECLIRRYHRQGIYYHHGIPLGRADTVFGYSDPPPDIWDSRYLIARNCGSESDDERVGSFLKLHTENNQEGDSDEERKP